MTELFKQCQKCRAWTLIDGSFCSACIEETKRAWEKARHKLYMEKLADRQPGGGPIYSSPPFDEVVNEDDLRELAYELEIKKVLPKSVLEMLMERGSIGPALEEEE